MKSQHGKVQGITHTASQRIEILLSHLLTDLETIHQLEDEFSVLLVYPFESFPTSGLHLQRHGADIVSQLSRTGFTTDQIEALKAGRVISQVVSLLAKLTVQSIGESESESFGFQKSQVEVQSILETLIQAHSQTGSFLTTASSIDHEAISEPIEKLPTPDSLVSETTAFTAVSTASDGVTAGEESHSAFVDFNTLDAAECIVCSAAVTLPSSDIPATLRAQINSAHDTSLETRESGVDGIDDGGRSRSGSDETADTSEVSLLDSPIDGEDELALRGRDAEEADMWLVAVTCLVNLITSTVGRSIVLLDEFEQCGGFRLMSKILASSSPDRLMTMMTLSMRLLHDPLKGINDPISFPNSAVILQDLLSRVIGLGKSVAADTDVESLVKISALMFKNKSEIRSKEHIIQNVAYALLTLYSNTPINGSILEAKYNFLPTLLSCLPALSTVHTISAVHTILNYVCQCVESAAELPIVAMVAAASVILANLLAENMPESDDQATALYGLELIYASIDEMAVNPVFLKILLGCGVIRRLIGDPLERLCVQAIQDSPHSQLYKPVRMKLLKLLLRSQDTLLRNSVSEIFDV